MSARAAHATRREIRRAFGVAAVDTIQQHEDAVSRLTATVHTLAVSTNSLRETVETLRQSHTARLHDLQAEVDAFRAQRLLARVRWLVFGTPRG